MRQRQLMFAVMGLFAFLGSANADSISFGVRVGPTSFSYNARPWAPAYHPYHPRPYPVYVAPAPVYVRPAPYYLPPPVVIREYAPVVQPAPVVIRESVPVVQQVPAVQVPATSSSIPPVESVQYSSPTISREQDLLQQLSDPREIVRKGASLDLGRMRSTRAVESLMGLAQSDASPAVRDAAVRALGLIGSPRAYNALLYSAQNDPDRDVRNSAQFAVDILRSNSQR